MENADAGCVMVPGRDDVKWSAIVNSASTLLSRCSEFIRALPVGAYTFESALLHGGTIGKHLRHLTDHYVAITRAVSGDGCVDYDHRERDVPMECCIRTALETLADLEKRVQGLSSRDAASSVRVRVMINGQGDEAVLASSLGRELAFATHHAVHHQAMMRAIAIEIGAGAPRESFGLAPSTAHHQNSRASG